MTNKLEQEKKDDVRVTLDEQLANATIKSSNLASEALKKLWFSTYIGNGQPKDSCPREEGRITEEIEERKGECPREEGILYKQHKASNYNSSSKSLTIINKKLKDHGVASTQQKSYSIEFYWPCPDGTAGSTVARVPFNRDSNLITHNDNYAL